MGNCNVTLPDQLKNRARQEGINLSKALREYLESFLTEGHSNVDVILLKKKLALLDEELAQKQAERNAISAKIFRWERQQKEDEIAQLEDKKQREEAASACEICKGRVIAHNEMRFNGHLLHKECFFAASKEQRDSWQQDPPEDAHGGRK